MINYPNGKRQQKQKFIPANLGMDFEVDINLSNSYYLEKNVAIIHKKPTPIQIVQVNYPSRNKAKITEAYFKTPSTTDYNGVYKGKYLDFDAKVTSSKTSFPYSNFHNHQIKHLINIEKHGGLGFFLIKWKVYDEIYLIKINDLMNYINSNTRKSIPYEDFKKISFPIKKGYLPRINYLETIDIAYNLK